MNPLTVSVFDLPARLSAKADPALIGDDESHFAAVIADLDRERAELTERLDAERRAPGGAGQAAMDRDLEIHRLTARLRLLRRFGADLCLGRMVPADGTVPVYVGRIGLTDGEGQRLLVDWRAPAAAPFFAATHADPMGLASRRRYRWSDGRITDYWDEVFTTDAGVGRAALDDQSAFVASLAVSRTPRMRDVLATIQADQDAIIRADSAGTLVVDGGPGTGKTVVALHRAAYLLYSDPRLGHRRGGVLFVGPHRPYLDYVADVLPGLGEDGVQTCTLRDLVVEGADAVEETDAATARLKASVDPVGAVDAAVRFYEQPPSATTTVGTEWAEVRVTAADWAEAFDAAEPGTPHNDARQRVWEALVALVVDKHDANAPGGAVRAAVERDRDLRQAFGRAWPLLSATDLIGDLWTVPAFLRLAVPGLTGDEVRRMQRLDPGAWTVGDLPWLDAARFRLGDPDAARQRVRRQAALAAQRTEMAKVVDDLLETDDSEMRVMSMLRGEDLLNSLDDESVLDDPAPDRLAGPFAHVIVDEAQELTDAQWQMLLLRCPSHSITVVGDRAQARHGFTESWEQRLTRVGLRHVNRRALTVNYRTPSEVMAVAEPVIRAVLPDANVPTSVRSTGVPVRRADTGERDQILAAWAAANAEGTACVVGDPGFEATARVRSLTPELTKGMEFDLVVLVEPDGFGDDVTGAVDRYVAMTRPTRQLIVLTGPPSPD